MTEFPLDKGDRGRQISVRIGDVLSLRLQENPTTGFLWRVEELDERFVVAEDSRFSVSEAGGIGGGGVRVLSFRAKASGTSPLRLALLQAWEPSSVSERFEITVKVA
jgi:inhibitor of cysteine peptidase